MQWVESHLKVTCLLLLLETQNTQVEVLSRCVDADGGKSRKQTKPPQCGSKLINKDQNSSTAKSLELLAVTLFCLSKIDQVMLTKSSICLSMSKQRPCCSLVFWPSTRGRCCSCLHVMRVAEAAVASCVRDSFCSYWSHFKLKSICPRRRKTLQTALKYCTLRLLKRSACYIVAHLLIRADLLL